MRKLNTKYNEKALLPAVILEGIQRGDVVETKDGVQVVIDYLCTWNNENGWSAQDLDVVTRRLYEQPFAKVQQVWKGRMHIDDWWHKVKMTRVEDMPKVESKADARRMRR